MKTYLLLHGAWHGAWAWEDVNVRLREAGNKVIAVDLPSHGDDETPVQEVTFDKYVTRVKEELDKLDEKVILVGHSLAGVIISQIAEERPDKIEALVYLAAFILEEDQTLVDFMQQDKESQLLANLKYSEDQSYAYVEEETLKSVVYNDGSAEQIAKAAPRLKVQSTQPFFAKVSLSDENFGRQKKYFIECTEDKILSLEAQRYIQSQFNCQRLDILKSGHVPQITKPEKVTEALLRIR
jgi:pimeloyl-ACP methyl ester carboxylesterase